MDETEWERRYRERERVNTIEETARKAIEDVEKLRRDFDERNERMAHNIVDQLSDLLAAEMKAFKAELKAEQVEFEHRIENIMKTAMGGLMSKEDAPDLVKKEYHKVHAAERSASRSNWKFVGWAVLSLLSIASAVGTVIYWVTQLGG